MMLSESRKRQRAQGDDDTQLMPQNKRSSTTGHAFERNKETWESESSSSDSSGVGSPEHGAGSSSSSSSQCGTESLRPCSPLSLLEPSGPANLGSYHNINRILREAHFQSLHNRGQSRDR